MYMNYSSASLFPNQFFRNPKPFIKWVGGKGQLIPQIESYLPFDFSQWNDVTYIEPFVGGGAMLFQMLAKYTNIKKAVINDINPYLCQCYTVLRDKPNELINILQDIEHYYKCLPNEESRKDYFLYQRQLFNEGGFDDVTSSANFIFLNKTCFNGLYRENKKGHFNVPFGRYNNPCICDTETILADSHILAKVEIVCGDFANTFDYAKGKTLFYLDPPYRPLTPTSNFTSYTKYRFNDTEQYRLKKFCDKINANGFYFLLSNSDGLSAPMNDDFMDKLFANYNIARVWATRNVNSDATKRGKLSEVLVRNYRETITPVLSL